jgi:hypothetical protein
MLSGVAASGNDGKMLCSQLFGAGTDIWGFPATNTHYYSGSGMDSAEGVYIWSAASSKWAEIRPGKGAIGSASTGYAGTLYIRMLLLNNIPIWRDIV